MRRIDGFENYSVTSCGKVYSHNANRFLALHDNGHGYLMINLWKDGVRKNMSVHRLVASAYIPRNISCSEVNHIDGNKKNNNVDNLEWCTHEHNMIHAVKKGLSSRGVKRKNNNSGYVGVHKLKNGKFQAHIKVNGKSKTIGYYNDAIEAAKARDTASIAIHGDTGKLNFNI